jgi:L-threonylcarbamoyladenylate synthase
MMEVTTSLEEAVDVLNRGKCVIYPTETYYGLGARIDCREAVEHVVQLKGRLSSLSMIAADLDLALSFAQFSTPLRLLAEKFWPGPLTLVGEPRKSLHAPLTAADGTIALRVSSHHTAQALALRCGGFLTSGSANPRGAAPPSRLEDIDNHWGQGLMCLDMGNTPGDLASTIAGYRDGKVVLFREGGVSRSQLAAVLGFEPCTAQV